MSWSTSTAPYPIIVLSLSTYKETFTSSFFEQINSGISVTFNGLFKKIFFDLANSITIVRELYLKHRG